MSIYDAERIAGKRRAGKALAKLYSAAPRVRLTGWFGLGCSEDRKLTRLTVPDAGIDRICLAYRGLTPNGATRSAGRLATEATLFDARDGQDNQCIRPTPNAARWFDVPGGELRMRASRCALGEPAP
jgi:hypothetical protein